MGGDGGSIPKRIEQVTVKRKQQRLERDLINSIRWRTCTHTQLPLKPPIVACQLGRLYSKESMLEALLERQLASSELTKHIRSSKDLKTLNLTENPAFDPDKIEKGDEYANCNLSPYICPVSGLEMNGTHRFVVIWKCGCVLSEKAFNEIPTEKCHVCAEPFDRKSDVHVLNPTAEELATLTDQLYDQRASEKAAKRLKKSEKAAIDGPSTSTDPAAKSLKRPKHDSNNGSAKAKKPEIQDDPKTTSVFKNLFTTSEVAKARPKNHWQTFDPRYF